MCTWTSDQAEPITWDLGLLGSHSIFSKPQLLPELRSAARTANQSFVQNDPRKGPR